MPESCQGGQACSGVGAGTVSSVENGRSLGSAACGARPWRQPCGRDATAELEDAELHLRSGVDGDERVPAGLEDDALRRRGGVDGDEHVQIDLEGEVRQNLVVVDKDDRGGTGGEVDEWTHPLGKPQCSRAPGCWCRRRSNPSNTRWAGRRQSRPLHLEGLVWG